MTDDPLAIPLVHLGTVDSTNNEAKRRLAAGDVTEPFAIVAGEQTAGRGTRGRTWDSPPGAGLYLSLVLPGGVPPLDVAGPGPGSGEAPPVRTVHTLAAGVAAADAVSSIFDIPVRLKPINDLLVDGAKLAGVLVETVVRGGRIDAMVVGVGINLRGAQRRVADGALPPVSVEVLRPPAVPITLDEERRLARALAGGLVNRIGQVVRGDEDGIRRAWLERAIPGAELPIG